MPLDAVQKIADANMGGKGEVADGVPVAPFQVYVAGKWRWARAIGETSANGIRVRRLVDVGAVV